MTSTAPSATDSLRPGAQIALACLDLTLLNDHDTAADVTRLCQRAQTRFGPVAAVCVWPHFVAQARAALPAPIAVAAVANFPHGSSDVGAAVQDAQQIVQAGGNEVDLVLPWRALQSGDDAAVLQLLTAVRQACPGARLKVILETGALQTPALIGRACALALQAGADFLKTSTGKTPISATPEAAALMLQAIAQGHHHHVGFKASGGIRTAQDAMVYEALVAQYLGSQALQPKRFRIGASSLLDDLEALLGQTRATPQAPGSY